MHAPRRQRQPVEQYKSQESLRTLAKRYGINLKTVAKWKKRTSVADLPTGPKQPHSTVLSIEEEAAIVAFREHGIEHHLTQVQHPWTNGQVERMNWTIKEATVKRFHYDDHAQLRLHLASFMDAYNFVGIADNNDSR